MTKLGKDDEPNSVSNNSDGDSKRLKNTPSTVSIGRPEEIYSNYIHKSRYARYLPEEKRRENWSETVDRYIKFFKERDGNKCMDRKLLSEIQEAIYNKEIMPSMRCLMTAGPALERDNVAGYNCAYTPIDNKRVFDEIMYILLCGTGVGFSVERQYVDKLPEIPEEFHPANATITVADSKIGWASAFRKLTLLLYEGLVPELDYSRLRPAGAVLKTFGGRASGPAPLQNLFNYTIALFEGAKGRKLNELECHDLVCKTAESIVCGGVRRSALISLSNLTSERLRLSKSGAWYHTDTQRSLANNSVCYSERPDVGVFLREWSALYESKSGERGIFNRAACESQLPDHRGGGHEWGTNPCSEIVLRPRQFCNLTEVVARPDDTEDSLKRKVELATIVGTMQSTLTDFRYLGKKWRDNCEEERLLGVSITGIMDCPLLRGASAAQQNKRSGCEEQHVHNLKTLLSNLKHCAIDTNKEWAKKFDIPHSAAITCVKPSGTVSQLVNSSSGIHPRYSQYYIRRVRQSINDPISQVLIDYGVPYETDLTDDSTYVFEFPIQAPHGTEAQHSQIAINQLNLWKVYAEHWCEHKPSVSIYVGETEWLAVADWVYQNFDILSGVSFFPRDNHTYRQAPFESITRGAYYERAKIFGQEIEYGSEDEDVTTASQELACQGGQCEI